MRDFNIYLSGGMTGLSEQDASNWRKIIREAIELGDYSFYDYIKHPRFFDPTSYYCIANPTHKSEREVFEFDLASLRKSDLVIVNFNAPQSIGTAMELVLAKELNIPVIGINPNCYVLHPWLLECVTRMCDSWQELFEHVAEYYLS